MAMEKYTEAGQAFTVYLALRPNILDAYVQEHTVIRYDSAKMIRRPFQLIRHPWQRLILVTILQRG